MTSAFAVAALAMAGGDASANALLMRASTVQLYSTSDASGSTAMPRDVVAGGTFTISGECVADADDDVRVVLSLADGAAPRTGWHAMLVTDMEVEDGNLRVHVPNMPEARNHVYRVRLFVGEDDPRVCDAGSIRIG